MILPVLNKAVDRASDVERSSTMHVAQVARTKPLRDDTLAAKATGVSNSKAVSSNSRCSVSRMLERSSFAIAALRQPAAAGSARQLYKNGRAALE